jgi:hypothetical protein
MKANVLVLTSVLVLFTTLTALAQQTTRDGRPIPAPAQAGEQPLVDNPQTATACNFCFTCGGDWPIFAGFENVNEGGHLQRGGSCSGDFQSIDLFPFLCCR